MAIFALLSGPLGKLGEWAVIIGGVLLVGWLLLQQHDKAIIAALQAKQEVAARQVEAAQVARVNAAVDQVASEAADRIASLTANQKVIYAAPRSASCAGSPALRALRDELQHNAGPGGSAPAKSAGVAAVVQSGAGAGAVDR